MMNNAARYGFPSFAAMFAVLALVGGCKTGPARVDGRAISRLRPGHARFEDVQALLGPPTSVEDWLPENPEIARTACWGPKYFDWIFYLRHDGTVQQFEPHMYTWTLADIRLPGSRSAESYVPPYQPPKAVSRECVERFVPGLTSQCEIVAALGPCAHATALEDGRFAMSWGSHRDSWQLEFGADGRLAATPQHYRP